jgi:predicted dehydrogenase
MNANTASLGPNENSAAQLTAMTRRRFMASAGASAASLAVLNPCLAAEAGPKINLGLIGCGGRGTWIANLFLKHGGYNLVAIADYFPDKANAAGEKLGVPAAKRFSGLSGYRRLLEEKVDAVAIISPPYFHPEQAAAAINAGKHVYLAKPIAVDVPGCQTVEESGKRATSKRLVFLVDFQTRATPAYQEVVKRVAAGEIGAVRLVEAAYFCRLYFANVDAEFRRSPKDATARLRAWPIDRVLSGDIITEQNIHALDVATWFLNAAPLKAAGGGGRARDFQGDCWDNFSVTYTFPGDVLVNFCSKQFGPAYDDILCRVHGINGFAETHYGGKVFVRGKEDGFSDMTNNIYEDGAVRNIAAFHQSITEGHYENATVPPSVRSNLTTILGRTAAYQQREVTWAEMMKANEKWKFDAQGLQT